MYICALALKAETRDHTEHPHPHLQTFTRVRLSDYTINHLVIAIIIASSINSNSYYNS